MVERRRRHTAAFKFRVALEAIEGSKTIRELSSEHEIYPNLIRVHTGRNRGPAGRRGRRM